MGLFLGQVYIKEKTMPSKLCFIPQAYQKGSEYNKFGVQRKIPREFQNVVP